MRLLTAMAMVVCVSTAAQADQATVDGVHICCGACVQAIGKTLEGIDGVSNAACDKDGAQGTFDCTDRAAARRGVAALAAAGFGGEAEYSGKAIRLPHGAAAEGEGNNVSITGVHNCCGGCAEAIKSALGDVDGVASVECAEQTCTVTGENVSHMDLIEALHAAGLHGTIAAE
jgi:mercuric ion binding protein